MTSNHILATYLIETSRSLEQTAELIAGEQSSGTFVAVPGETDELRARARAKVLDIQLLSQVAAPSLPGARMDQRATILRPRSRSLTHWTTSDSTCQPLWRPYAAIYSSWQNYPDAN